ncbi:Oidioi.mRNA.OKI2018_I69.chr1.g414.t1.cds [Oikopleura dioica]|uniref:Metalloendopeptidase n=1 Tax=Oikopleura dioica TaxID=34765 RepID=A0ABN7SP64_OIKDI|nr:Oidioi.mRNA.OKI2018_I69.chr1.g414.t1.cds [Oikopleura dioica]
MKLLGSISLALASADRNVEHRSFERPKSVSQINAEGTIPNGIKNQARQGFLDGAHRWHNRTIPISLNRSLDENGSGGLFQAIRELEEKNIARFKPAGPEDKDSINVMKGGGCWSWYGRLSGEQELSLGTGCGWMNVAIHELFHAMGMAHTQMRSDRDEHVEILWENISEEQAYNFDKLDDISFSNYGFPYDKGS